MEKYAVQIDPTKVDKEKEKNAEKGKTLDDPNCNVPLDPIEGSKPFEKEAEKGANAKAK